MASFFRFGVAIFLSLLVLASCSSPPKPPPKEIPRGWYGEKLPPGIVKRTEVLPGEPPLRKANGEKTDDPREAKEYLRERDRAVMVFIPEGNSVLGASKWESGALKSEKPQVRIFLSSYYIDKYEITAEKFQRFVEATGYKTTAEKKEESKNWNGEDWVTIKGLTWKNPWPENLEKAPGFHPRHPVVHISYHDAQAYCKWTKAHLPTEAQWEKAARGEDGLVYPWGNQPPASGEFFSNSSQSKSWNFLGLDGYFYTAPVGSFPQGASPYGCMDMVGNVWEWCLDQWSPKFYRRLALKFEKTQKAIVDPLNTKPSKGRPIRGGGWAYTHKGGRAASRGVNYPHYTAGDLGFRCLVPLVPRKEKRENKNRKDSKGGKKKTEEM